MKKCNCPKCGKELIRLKVYYPGFYLFFCNDCGLEITVTDKESTRKWLKGETVKDE